MAALKKASFLSPRTHETTPEDTKIEVAGAEVALKSLPFFRSPESLGNVNLQLVRIIDHLAPMNP